MYTFGFDVIASSDEQDHVKTVARELNVTIVSRDPVGPAGHPAYHAEASTEEASQAFLEKLYA